MGIGMLWFWVMGVWVRLCLSMYSLLWLEASSTQWLTYV